MDFRYADRTVLILTTVSADSAKKLLTIFCKNLQSRRLLHIHVGNNCDIVSQKRLVFLFYKIIIMICNQAKKEKRKKDGFPYFGIYSKK